MCTEDPLFIKLGALKLVVLYFNSSNNSFLLPEVTLLPESILKKNNVLYIEDIIFTPHVLLVCKRSSCGKQDTGLSFQCSANVILSSSYIELYQ